MFESLNEMIQQDEARGESSRARWMRYGTIALVSAGVVVALAAMIR